MPAHFPIHIRTLGGLEDVLAQELEALGAKGLQKRKRLVVCEGDLAFLYRINLWCRTAIRVLRPVSAFPAPDEKAFYDGVRAIDWSPWLAPEGTLLIDAHVHSSFTTHSLYLAQLGKDAIVDQFREKTGTRPSVDLKSPELRIAVSLFENTAQILVDASGDSLHRRGYRLRAGEAPLNEVLAAGILKLSGWDGTTPLLDPMCGSGTFLIEAATLQQNRAPGLLRKRFGFQSWSDYDAPLFEALREEARKSIRTEGILSLVGLECDPVVAQIARENVQRAGLGENVKIETADFFQWPPPSGPGFLVFNPPYNERMAMENIAEFYQSIGDRLANAYEGWNAWIFSGNARALDCLGLRRKTRFSLFNGALPCTLNSYELKAGEPYREPALWRTQAPQENPQWKEKGSTFRNRLLKNYKHLSKWAKREGVSSWRVYNWDIPELPFYVDIFQDHLYIAEVPRNHAHSPLEHDTFIQFLLKIAGEALGFAPDKIHFKERKPKKTGGAAFSADPENFHVVQEGRLSFYVNFADFLEVGWPLEYRKARSEIQKEAQGKDFLNLYGYTGSFSLAAAAGGARSTVTVDTAKTALEWAENNFQLNEIPLSAHALVRSDAIEFLKQTRKAFDLCIVDPPVRSINRSTGAEFHVQTHHAELLENLLEKVRPGGKVFFFTHYREFQLDKTVLQKRNILISEITAQTQSPDFARPSYKAFLFRVP